MSDDDLEEIRPMSDDAITDEYVASVYRYEDQATFVRRTELPQELRERVDRCLDALPSHLWSPLAAPADHFFMRENRRLPMRAYLDFLKWQKG